MTGMTNILADLADQGVWSNFFSENTPQVIVIALAFAVLLVLVGKLCRLIGGRRERKILRLGAKNFIDSADIYDKDARYILAEIRGDFKGSLTLPSARVEIGDITLGTDDNLRIIAHQVVIKGKVVSSPSNLSISCNDLELGAGSSLGAKVDVKRKTELLNGSRLVVDDDSFRALQEDKKDFFKSYGSSVEKEEGDHIPFPAFKEGSEDQDPDDALVAEEMDVISEDEISVDDIEEEPGPDDEVEEGEGSTEDLTAGIDGNDETVDNEEIAKERTTW